MPIAWRGFVLALLAALPPMAVIGADEQGKILRPSDGAALTGESVDIIATAPGGRLELDGKAIEAAEPFPDVFHAKAPAAAGVHSLALLWDGGRKEIRFFLGANPPAEFKAFRAHPPQANVECAQCHGISSRGRFRFEGGCFACHVEDNFTKTHPHPVHVLEQCGLCHNAHGSTEETHLLHPKETACKLCHG
jgi:hypothetical protein